MSVYHVNIFQLHYTKRFLVLIKNVVKLLEYINKRIIIMSDVFTLRFLFLKHGIACVYGWIHEAGFGRGIWCSLCLGLRKQGQQIN